MNLAAGNSCIWQFTRKGKPQTVKEPTVVQGNYLVLQPDSFGMMLSEITLGNDQTFLIASIGEMTKLTVTTP